MIKKILNIQRRLYLWLQQKIRLTCLWTENFLNIFEYKTELSSGSLLDEKKSSKILLLSFEDNICDNLKNCTFFQIWIHYADCRAIVLRLFFLHHLLPSALLWPPHDHWRWRRWNDTADKSIVMSLLDEFPRNICQSAIWWWL